MKAAELAETLHPLERKVLPLLEKPTQFDDILKSSKLSEVEVMRALQWLRNKQLITLTEEKKELITLSDNGKKYAQEGLPESRVLALIADSPKSLAELTKQGIDSQELNIAIGVLRKEAAISFTKEKEMKLAITDAGKKLLKSGFPADAFIKKKFPVAADDLSEKEKLIQKSLSARKDILKLSPHTSRKAVLTKEGKEVLQASKKTGTLIDRLTTDILKSGSWKGKGFRRFDITSDVPRIWTGRKQHYRSFQDSVRQRFMALGFKEMSGPIVETDFWDMDALFMPQFHSARDIHAAYYIKEPKYSKDIPKDILDKVQQAHENGLGTGSRGWRYPFDVKRTCQQLLRTQGTACSARTLASKELEIPGKYFAMARCFRYDVIDATHNCDFFQTEGIVVEEGLNLRHLIGLLKMFAREFAEADEIKVVPAYFPFTEPSASLYAKHPEMGWIELGGSGIFRPEMTRALGIDVPVIAWGIGIDRIAMFKLGLNDIRDLFSHDIGFLRNARLV